MYSKVGLNKYLLWFRQLIGHNYTEIYYQDDGLTVSRNPNVKVTYFNLTIPMFRTAYLSYYFCSSSIFYMHTVDKLLPLPTSALNSISHVLIKWCIRCITYLYFEDDDQKWTFVSFVSGKLLLSWPYSGFGRFLSQCDNLFWNQVSCTTACSYYKFITRCFSNGNALVFQAMFVWSWTAQFCPLSIEVLLSWKSKYTWLSPWPTTLMEIMPSTSTNIWGGREALVMNQKTLFMTVNHQWLSPQSPADG